jgi:hypothetical protein
MFGFKVICWALLFIFIGLLNLTDILHFQDNKFIVVGGSTEPNNC